ncbi:hypothetical protein EWI61_09600 [Methylolobus aquaticus]|nr:hypothetical protein EWI61_09600 [Methylolobus aquaticus]
MESDELDRREDLLTRSRSKGVAERVFDSLITPMPQIPHDAVFSISSGIATVLIPQINTATALAPETLHARMPSGPPMAIFNQRYNFCFITSMAA